MPLISVAGRKMAIPSDKTGNSPFEGLDPEGNEAYSPQGRLDRQYRRCLVGFAALSARELSRRQAFIERATADLGLNVDRLDASPDPTGAFRMDLFPRIIRPAEWAAIEAGVRQRMEAFGAFIRDIHGPQEILRNGVIPPELVFEDPAFHPELHGLPIPANGPLTIGAVDLLRTAEGRWIVLENRLSTPTGFSYVIQARRILAQALPELFARFPVHPVASFATRLSEALTACAAPVAGRPPVVVLLSESEQARHFFEESFLARHMGIPLTHPQDIVVREGRVFLRTIAGLHPVDVIYRRLEPPHLDPVAFSCVNDQGIPGLVHCLRRGTVQVANFLGSGVADNRALLPYSNDIIRTYTGQRPLLPTAATFHGFDLDQADWIRDHLDELTLKTVCHPETLKRAKPEAGRLFETGRLAELLKADPRLVVAQELPAPSRLPLYDGRRAQLEGLVMRVYCILGKRPFFLPGGLTRLNRKGHEWLAAGSRFHVLKDTWVLRQKPSPSEPGGRLEARISTVEFPLPSRAAEAFYWMGRYLERGCGTARMINTLEELRWGELSPGERELYTPLWNAILEATGGRKRPQPAGPKDPSPLTESLLFDASEPASVAACLASVRRNARGIRSFITPELWKSTRDAADRFIPGARRPRGTALRDFLESVTESGDRLYGTAQRTLLHDAGWHFLNMGLHLERGLTHVSVLSQVLPRIARRQWQHLRDDSDLTALLRLLGALDAYHRHYRSRAYLDRVAELLWKAPLCPASVVFAAAALETALHSLERVSEATVHPGPLLAETTAFIGWTQALPLERIFPARARELDTGLSPRNAPARETIQEAEGCLARMQAFFESFHEQLEGRFFSHHPDSQRTGP